ncbi:endo-polygalacturonase PG1 [Gautieria morchelliformis]|nr:endo-polygalacturonase PG1 [Gautieria morchelliformis]
MISPLPLCLVVLLPSLLVVAAPSRPPSQLAKRCTGTIANLGDVANALRCTTININAFTVPARSQLNLALLDGTTVNLNGDIRFGNASWAGPQFQISGNSITFNGNGHSFDGGGPFYWDGLGSNGGTQKPTPMMKIRISGTFKGAKVINSPAQAFAITNPGHLVISDVIVDNSQGDQPNSKSKGQPAGHNTDAFDVSVGDLIIQNSSVRNQDDCLAINNGTNITFKGNKCSGGHGISIGSIGSGVSVSNIVISGNTITNSDQALRIKTNAAASGSTVSGITYSGNTGTGLKRFGVLIDQSYPKVLGTPKSGVKIGKVNFVGNTNTLKVDSTATPVAINCGTGACTSLWSWTSLKTSGGKANFLHNAPKMTGYTL